MSAEKVQERLDEAVELAIVTDADIDEVLVKMDRARARLQAVQDSGGGA